LKPRDKQPNIPEALDQIILKALEKDSDLRCQSAKEILTDLKRFKRELDSGRWMTSATAKSKELPSIAVLPFLNMSADPDAEYFSDGLTEDIIAQLSKIEDLKVISRTSVMLYRNTEKNLRQIGEELGVATILEGSVRRAEGKVRVVAQLIDAETDENLWAETYDRPLKDIFAIQSDVAEQIAAALRLELSNEERERIRIQPTQDLTAYDFYLKGSNSLWSGSPPEHSISLFNRSLELDSQFAPAFVGLAFAYVTGVHQFGYGEESLEKAIECAERALALDASLADAHVALSFAFDQKGWKQKALESAEKAVRLEPRNPDALGNLADRYHFANRFDESYLYHRKALELDPRSAGRYVWLATDYMAMGEYEKAVLWVRKAQQISPDGAVGHFGHLTLIRSYLGLGKVDEALKVSRDYVALSPDNVIALCTAGIVALAIDDIDWARELFEKASRDNPTARYLVVASVSSLLGSALMKEGETREAERLFRESIRFAEAKLEQGDESQFSLGDLAITYSMWGKKEQACKWLEKAVDTGWCWHPDVTTPAYWENIQGEDCYEQLMVKVDARLGDMRHRVEELEKEWEQ
jgi:protein kinase/serine/threonine-protein kinase